MVSLSTFSEYHVSILSLNAVLLCNLSSDHVLGIVNCIERKHKWHHDGRFSEGQNQWMLSSSHFFYREICQKAWCKAICQITLVYVFVFSSSQSLVSDLFKSLLTFARLEPMGWIIGTIWERYSVALPWKVEIPSVFRTYHQILAFYLWQIQCFWPCI